MTPTTNNVEPTTSATDKLRRLLTERGAEWEDMSIRPYACTSWRDLDGELCTALEGADDIPDGKLSVQVLLTPEQAVEATLGRGTCRAVYSPNGVYCSVCHGGGLTIPRRGVNALRNYCPNCGRKVVS